MTSTERARKLREKLLARYLNICKDFGSTDLENLQFHHVKPTGVNGQGRGSWTRHLDILHHPDAYVLVCRDCHKKRYEAEGTPFGYNGRYGHDDTKGGVD